jgi:streptomycin 6-kinase
VLKTTVPNVEVYTEAAALFHYDGRGIARLVEADVREGVLLIERLRPGSMLLGLDDEQATRIAASVLTALWRPPPADHAFPTVAQWAAGLTRLRQTFDGDTGPFPGPLVTLAEGLYAQMAESPSEPVLLHGDFHHFNILTATREPWLAIDPKGVVGEPAYELGPFLLNQLPDSRSTSGEAQAILARRIHQLSAELAIPRPRIIAAATAHAVLSAWWTYEDHGHPGEEALATAALLARLL